MIDFRPERCRSCGRRLKGDDPTPARHQVSEIPCAQTEVTEYRRHTLDCAACGAKTEAEWGEKVPEGSFGARLQATVAYLTGRLGLSHRDSVEALSVLHGASLSLGSVSALQRQVSHALAAPVETAREFVQQQAVNNVDETGWCEEGKLHWLWVNVTPQVSAFRIAARRDSATARQVIGHAREGRGQHGSVFRLQLDRPAPAADLLGAPQARLPSDDRAWRRVARDRRSVAR